jgi:hypothetical protein
VKRLKETFSVTELVRNGNRIKPPIKECSRILLVSSSEEPDEGKLQVRFCEGERQECMVCAY